MIRRFITFIIVLMIGFSNSYVEQPTHYINTQGNTAPIIDGIESEVIKENVKNNVSNPVEDSIQPTNDLLSPSLEEADFTQPVPIPLESTKQVEITISFAGDCTIGTDTNFSYTNSFPDRLNKVNNDFGYFFSGVKHIFEQDDLTLVNLETTLTTATKKADKKFCFIGHPSYVNILKEGSIEMVNISNNHIYDYLQEGFDETLQVLDEAGIYYSGEGIIAYYETKGMTIASIGYNGWGTYIEKSLAVDIQQAREKADLVIVSFHWGQERVYYPNNTQKRLGRFAIDQGADVVVGHHPHVIQGIEQYKGKYIVYSLGNFCFGGNRNPSDKDTIIFQNKFVFEQDALIENIGIVIPCSISSVSYVNDFKPVVLQGEDRERVINRVLEYSKN